MRRLVPSLETAEIFEVPRCFLDHPAAVPSRRRRQLRFEIRKIQRGRPNRTCVLLPFTSETVCGLSVQACEQTTEAQKRNHGPDEKHQWALR
jgi:hypothetical protein